MGYCMLIGLCLNANLNMGINADDSVEEQMEKYRPSRRKGLLHLGYNFKANRWRKDRENV